MDAGSNTNINEWNDPAIRESRKPVPRSTQRF